MKPQDKLKELINKSGLSQEKFSEKLGIKRSALSDILTGRVKKIQHRVAEALEKEYPEYPLIYWKTGILETATDQEPQEKESGLEEYVTDGELDELVNVLSENKILLLQCLSAIQHHKKELKLFLAGLD